MSKLFATGQVVELRYPRPTGRGWAGGWFDDHALMAKEAQRISQAGAKAVYVTLNPVNPALLARCANRVAPFTEVATSDSDIVERRWLPIDIDPIRPANVSSTEAEHQAALAMAATIRAWLEQVGWPLPLLADSGNGAHLLYRVQLPNDPEALLLVKRCLAALAARFSDEQVEVDLKNSNAARIWKCYGTMTRKGDDRPDRPHRLSKLLEVPEAMREVPVEGLMQLADTVTAPATPETGRDFQPADWLHRHDLRIAREGEWNGTGYRWLLSCCPFNGDHTDRSAVVLRHPSGAVSFSCMHNSCAGNDWQALRDLLEPGWREPLPSGFKGPPEAHQGAIVQNTGKPTSSPLQGRPTAEEVRISVASIKTGRELADSYREYIQALQHSKILLGFPEIDERTRGIGPGEVMTVIAKSRAGKSAFLQNVLLRLGRAHQVGSLFLSMEQPNAQVFERYVQMALGVQGSEVEHEWVRSTESQQAFMEQVLKDLGDSTLTCDLPGLTLPDVEQAIAVAREKSPLPLALVAVDYLGLLDGSDLDRTLYGQTSRVVRELKNVAKRHRIAVILLCQISRQVGDDGSKPLTINSARESGAIEEAADFLLGLYRPHIGQGSSDNQIALQILKNRKGLDGEEFRYSFSRTSLEIGAKNLMSEAEQVVFEERAW